MSEFTERRERLFYDNVEFSMYCWEWRGNICTDRGYGQFCQGSSTSWSGLVHRYAYMLYHPDEDISGLMVRHMCHNRRCVSPLHLKVGTNADNMQDRLDFYGPDAKVVTMGGQNHFNAKLTDSDVMEIRRQYAAGDWLTVIGERFGVSQSVVASVATGKSWPHLPGAVALRGQSPTTRVVESRLKEQAATQEKICTKCRVRKSLDDFSPFKYNPDGLTNFCRRCIADEARDRKTQRTADAKGMTYEERRAEIEVLNGSKLTDEQVMWAREQTRAGVDIKEIMNELDASKDALYRAITGIKFAHLPGALPIVSKHKNAQRSQERYAQIIESGQKSCSTCKITKSLSDFGNKTKMPDGKNSQCKSCVSDYKKSKSSRPRNVLTDDLVLKARALARQGQSFTAIARDFGVVQQTMHRAITGQTYGHLPDAFQGNGVSNNGSGLKAAAQDAEAAKIAAGGRVCNKCGLFKETGRFPLEKRTGRYVNTCRQCDSDRAKRKV